VIRPPSQVWVGEAIEAEDGRGRGDSAHHHVRVSTSLCDESLTSRCLNLNSRCFSNFINILVCVENHVCMSHGV
jgi:hypothetical protein